MQVLSQAAWICAAPQGPGALALPYPQVPHADVLLLAAVHDLLGYWYPSHVIKLMICCIHNVECELCHCRELLPAAQLAGC